MEVLSSISKLYNLRNGDTHVCCAALQTHLDVVVEHKGMPAARKHHTQSMNHLHQELGVLATVVMTPQVWHAGPGITTPLLTTQDGQHKSPTQSGMLLCAGGVLSAC